ncbi:twin-arginine translocase TatA/TatE family subunit [Desulfococcus sp.]|uniref:twin-arginine translocase TatA/TatE family subunit n=1 Tax=Desulfococcus sp. TaxID=2025834 RepID=UPI003593C26A
MTEVLLVLAIALIVIGPKKLPDLAKSLGRAMIEFKRATAELKSSLEVDTDVTDIKKTFKDMDRSLKTSMEATPLKTKSETEEAKADPPPPDAASAPPGPPMDPDSLVEYEADVLDGLKQKPEKEGAAKDDA